MVDIKMMADELIEKIKKDPQMLANFKNEPIQTIEKLIGIDLPDEQLERIVELVKTKLAVDDIADVAGKLKGLFGK